MSYRGIKRVLGETNLERKCRLLFGLCLALLITGAFWWVSTITENLAKDTARTTGRRLVDSYLLEYHLNIWETEPDKQELVRKMGEGLQMQRYRGHFLALDSPNSPNHPEVFAPEDEEERSILKELREELKVQSGELPSETGEADVLEEAVQDYEDLPALGDRENLVPVYRERRVALAEDPDKGEYQYYQPVYWKRDCDVCHRALQPGSAFTAADEGEFSEDAVFRVVKVAVPDDEMRGAIARTRAILITAGIVTVFVSMIALYIIVRYVIVKPLKHLRDVSDEISRGSTDLRADIHTNDEFEDLALSFNRMLRHMMEAQTELRKLNTDLDGKVDELAQANMQLYDMNRLKSDFLASMSHELRTPLNSIIGFSEVLNGIDALDDTQKRYVANIQKSGRVLLDMINDVLDLAKMESGKMEVRPSEFDIRTVITAQCDVVRSLTEEKNIDLECRMPTGDTWPRMNQDQSKVQQILTNLLSNAIKFTPEGGRITVSAQREATGLLTMTVTDTGVGIAEEDREIIFEKFRQSSATAGNDSLTREFSGTGLGLSIVRELCILLGGEVTFTSELGKGSAFTVRMPWDNSEAEPAMAEEFGSRGGGATRSGPPQVSHAVSGGATAAIDATAVVEKANS
jgi:two-component system sensor histidine kinase BarA